MPSQIHIHRRSALLSSQGQGQLVYRLHKRLSGEAANLFLRLLRIPVMVNTDSGFIVNT